MVKLGMRDRAAALNKELGRRRFERTVGRIVASLSDELRVQLDNLHIVVAEEPPERGRGADDDELFGLYEGTPLTQRTTDYGLTVPDKITIYRGPLERAFPDPAELYRQIRITVLHEIAHHFGIDEDRLSELGYE